MKIADTKIKKIFIFGITSILIAGLVVIVLISPIAKYLVEKYDVKYTGRQIKMDWAYVNPFTGYVHFSNLKIYESQNSPAFMGGDSIFFSAKGLSADFAMLKLLSKTIEITELTLDRPKGNVVQNGKDFNFNDLITRFTPVKRSAIPSKIQFNIFRIKIVDGEFYYHERVIPIDYFIKKVNIESTGKRWNADTIAVKFSLIPGTGSGDMKGNFTVNFKTADYRLAIVVHKFDLNIIEQYLRDMTNFGVFSANLDADMKARGNLRDEENLTASGQLGLNDFHFGRTHEDDYISFDKLVMAITEISPKNHQYLFDSISLIHPFLKYERYDYLDNVQMMFGKNGANIASVNSDQAKFNLVIEIARYVKVLAKNFFRSDYKIGRLAIYHGDLAYNDYAISEKFSVDLNPLYIIADSIDKNHKQVDVSLKSGIRPYGNATVTLSINPNDSMDFDIQYHLKKIPVALFNPYLVTYTSFPLDRGTIELNGKWKVRDGMIQSDNHVLIIDPRRTRRVRNKDKKWLPLPLIMSLVRERGNVIDYEIPITGNLKNPKFHLHDALMDLLENIFVKPATASYRLEVKDIETEIEESITLQWEMQQSSLNPNQEKFAKHMAEHLVKHREAFIDVYPQQYALKEKEGILFYEAKKKYFLLINHKNTRSFSKEDSESVTRMSVKDSLFVHYLNRLLRNPMLFTIQEKCSSYVGSALIESRFNRLNKEREKIFLLPFRERSVENRIKIHAAENNIPFNGFSYYKLTYKGELPEALRKAYRKMNELNDEAPRKKYKKERRANRTGQ